VAELGGKEGYLNQSYCPYSQYHIDSSKKEKKKKVGGRVKQREKNKRRPMMLTVLGCPPWTVTKEKTPQSDLIRKGTDTHNMKPGDRLVSGTVYMYTESSGSTKEGMGKVRSRRNYGSKRKRGEQSDRKPVDLPKDTDQQVQTVQPDDGSLCGSYTSHP